MENFKLVVLPLVKISQERGLHVQLYCMSTHFQLLTLLWTRIFHVCPHSINETRFYYFVKKKNCFGKKSESSLILFYFKGKIKQEIKP